MEISKNFGAKTIKRPKELADDNSSSESAIIHFAENIDFDILVFIQCTSPLIKPQDINKGIEKMKNFDSIVSVTETHQMFWNVDGPLYDINKRLRRQDSKKRYLETGGFYITTTKNLLESKNRMSGSIGFVEIPNYRSIDVDSIEDLKIAELIINSKISFDD